MKNDETTTWDRMEEKTESNRPVIMVFVIAILAIFATLYVKSLEVQVEFGTTHVQVVGTMEDDSDLLEVHSYPETYILWPWQETSIWQNEYTIEFGPENVTKFMEEKTSFADNIGGAIEGRMVVMLPSDKEQLLNIYSYFIGDPEMLTGTMWQYLKLYTRSSMLLMTSSESYTTKGQLCKYIYDQLQNGLYVTEAIEREIEDPFAGGEKTTISCRAIKKDANGENIYDYENDYKKLGIEVSELDISNTWYDKDFRTMMQRKEMRKEHSEKTAAELYGGNQKQTD